MAPARGDGRQPPLRQPLRSHFRTTKASNAIPHDALKPSARAKDVTKKGKAPEVNVDADRMDARPSTPPPRHDNGQASTSTPPSLAAAASIRTTPRTPKPRSRTATLPDADLFEPLQRSPVSVRTDPDTGKMFLMLPNSPILQLGVEQRQQTPSAIGKTPARTLFANTPSSSKAIHDLIRSPTTQPKAKRIKRSPISTDEEDGEENPFIVSPSKQDDQTGLFALAPPIQHIHPSTATAGTLHGSRRLPLPIHHATLYALHSALEHALVVHLATAGTAGSTMEEETITHPDGSASTMLAIPQLISFSLLRPLVERSSGRRFGKLELARLLWIWQGLGQKDEDARRNIGFSICRTRTVGKAGKRVWDLALGIRMSTDDEQVLEGEDAMVSSSGTDSPAAAGHQRRTSLVSAAAIGHPSTPHDQVRALGIKVPQSPSPSPRITRTPGMVHGLPRTPPMSPSHRWTAKHARRSSEEVTADILSSPSASPSTTYARRGISIVALWNNGLDRRKRIVRQRLLRWTLDCLAAWRATKDQSTSRQHGMAASLAGLGIRTEEDDIVIAQDAKPTELKEYITEWDQGFPLESVAPIPTAELPMPQPDLGSQSASPRNGGHGASTANVLPSSRKSRVEVAREAHQAVIAKSEETLGRKLTLTERIQAKERLSKGATEAANGASPSTAHVPSTSMVTPSTSASAIASAARQRAQLSRLQDMAEAIYMAFVTSSGAATSPHLSTQTKPTRFAPLPLTDCIKAVCSGSKQAMGLQEARLALQQLQRIAPGFVQVERIGMREWVRLVGRVHGVGVTEGAGILASVRHLVRLEMAKVDQTQGE